MIRAGISREFLRPLVAWGALVMLPLTMCPLSWSERAPLREPITSESEPRNSPEQCCPHSDVHRDQITRGPCANAALDSAGVGSCQARLTLRAGAVSLQEDFPFWQRFPITSLSSSNTPSMALLCICVRPRPPPPTRSGCPALTLAYAQCGEHFVLGEVPVPLEIRIFSLGLVSDPLNLDFRTQGLPVCILTERPARVGHPPSATVHFVHVHRPQEKPVDDVGPVR